jgi:hypothetical protein
MNQFLLSFLFLCFLTTPNGKRNNNKKPIFKPKDSVAKKKWKSKAPRFGCEKENENPKPQDSVKEKKKKIQKHNEQNKSKPVTKISIKDHSIFLKKIFLLLHYAFSLITQTQSKSQTKRQTVHVHNNLNTKENAPFGCEES